jgi:hypothetical protein
MYISPERKLSSVSGTGVQYLPGHVEPFVDLIVDDYLPSNGNIVDLGGGGLRIAIPVALAGRRITVVDLDEAGLDVEHIVQRVNDNNKLQVDPATVAPLIDIQVKDVLEWLDENQASYELMTAFRLLPYFSPDQMGQFFSRAGSAIAQNGLLAVSGLSAYDSSTEGQHNEFYDNSEPVSEENPLYRRFSDDPASRDLRESQNLPVLVHFIDAQFISSQAQAIGFQVIPNSRNEGNPQSHPSTRVVEGFVLRKQSA